MAKKVAKKNIRKTKRAKVLTSPFSIYWKKQNYYLLVLGFIVIIVGFYLMSVGSWNSFASLHISPVVLIIGFVIIFPAAILYRKKDKKEDTKESEIDSGKS
ncbi:DUF3098 domain-containing protein [bacterium BMS3Abin03]|jgi:uncharacterized membrane protein|nr:DUF3098 domain-containing protein [bacterium BMS3Abin03]